ncbi:hypothetical protein C5167_028728 [Papaver somniferum]|nr:hypothetical protein C5167_028728 [Papaver somniferum]
MSGEVWECSKAVGGFTMLSTVLSPTLCSLGGLSTFSKSNNSSSSKRRTMSERQCVCFSPLSCRKDLSISSLLCDCLKNTPSVSLTLRNGCVRILLLPSTYY